MPRSVLPLYRQIVHRNALTPWCESMCRCAAPAVGLTAPQTGQRQPPLWPGAQECATPASIDTCIGEKSLLFRLLFRNGKSRKRLLGKKNITDLAFGTVRRVILGLGPLGTVKRLVSREVVHRSELDAARRAYQLDERRRRRARRHRRWTRRCASGVASLAVVLLVRHEVFVSVKDYVALLAPDAQS